MLFCIDPIITGHFKEFIRDMYDQASDKINSRNTFCNSLMVLMALGVKGIYYYQLQLIEQEKSEAGENYHDRGLLFADEYGNYLRPWKVLKEFQQILKAVDIRKHRFHDLRHTFVFLLVRESQKAGEGIIILEVSTIVGHSDPTVTMHIYGGLFPNAMEKAMKILEDSEAIRLPIGYVQKTRENRSL